MDAREGEAAPNQRTDRNAVKAMKRRWSKSRKALLLTLIAFAVSCVLYLWLPYRVAVVQLFFKLGGSRVMIPAEYRPLDSPRYLPVAQVSAYPGTWKSWVWN